MWFNLQRESTVFNQSIATNHLKAAEHKGNKIVIASDGRVLSPLSSKRQNRGSEVAQGRACV